MDGSVLAVLAAYQNNLVSSENDDVTSGSMSPYSNVRKIRLLTGKSLNKSGFIHRECHLTVFLTSL